MALSSLSLFFYHYVWFKLVYEDRYFGPIMRITDYFALISQNFYNISILTSNINISLFYQLFFCNIILSLIATQKELYMLKIQNTIMKTN